MWCTTAIPTACFQGQRGAASFAESGSKFKKRSDVLDDFGRDLFVGRRVK